ncbi:recombinase RarA, partial [Lactobacillus sp. XV13L]|nr:recombinase RarA [Lactobacillus sp. XV13L]
ALTRALKDEQRGLGKYPVLISDDALDLLATATAGDLRSSLNGLELAVKSTPQNAKGKIKIDLTQAQESIQKKTITADKNGDSHYDVISAFQKSIRGSDANAALYYLARLLEAGDLATVIRRLMVTAYEDIGLANPPACQRTVT